MLDKWDGEKYTCSVPCLTLPYTFLLGGDVMESYGPVMIAMRGSLTESTGS